jgi:hypothetical protein
MRREASAYAPGVTQLPPGDPPNDPPNGPPGRPPNEPVPPEPPIATPAAPPASWTPATDAPSTPPPAPTPPPAIPPYGAPPAASAPDRVRMAWQRRHETDYVFDFWTALGWTILTCGIYGFYVLYQLVRCDRDHNLRRVELLDAATTYAWERASARGIAEEMQPAFERISMHMSVLRQQTTQFRDPIIWVVLDVIAGGIARIVAYCLMDSDLVKHDHAEGAIEAELSEIYSRLGAPAAPPDPGRLKGQHNYVARIIVLIVTCGIYGLWWTYDVMMDWNKHFEHNWRWEDGLAASVQSLMPTSGT